MYIILAVDLSVVKLIVVCVVFHNFFSALALVFIMEILFISYFGGFVLLSLWNNGPLSTLGLQQYAHFINKLDVSSIQPNLFFIYRHHF